MKEKVRRLWTGAALGKGSAECQGDGTLRGGDARPGGTRTPSRLAHWHPRVGSRGRLHGRPPRGERAKSVVQGCYFVNCCANSAICDVLERKLTNSHLFVR